MKALVKALLCAAVVCFASCSVSPPMPELPATHPASPSAPEAPRTATTGTLRMATGAAKEPGAEPAPHAHAPHGAKR